MRNRLLEAKKKDAKTPQKAVTLAHKFLLYVIEGTNNKTILTQNGMNVCINELVSAVQIAMINCFDHLISADSEHDLVKALDHLTEADNALDVVENMFTTLSDLRWVVLNNKKFIGKSISELRDEITHWIRYTRKKIYRKAEQAAEKRRAKN